MPLTIEERLVRQEPQDVIFFGDLAETHFKRSGLSTILGALSKGRTAQKLRAKMNGESADYILGSLKGYEQIISDIEDLMIERDNLKVERKATRKKKKETQLSQAPGDE